MSLSFTNSAQRLIRNAEDNLFLNEQHLTRADKLLRSLTLDELPELFNMLKGDTYIVGPGQLLVEYQDFYPRAMTVP